MAHFRNLNASFGLVGLGSLDNWNVLICNGPHKAKTCSGLKVIWTDPDDRHSHLDRWLESSGPVVGGHGSTDPSTLECNRYSSIDLPVHLYQYTSPCGTDCYELLVSVSSWSSVTIHPGYTGVMKGDISSTVLTSSFYFIISRLWCIHWTLYRQCPL